MKSRLLVLSVPLALAWFAAPAAAQTGYTTDVSAGVMMPAASLDTYYKPGLAINLGFSMTGGEDIRYHLGFGYYRTGLDNQALNDDPNSNPGGGRYEVGGAVSTFPIVVGLTLVSSKPEVKPYGVVEAGIFLNQKKFDGGTYTYPDGVLIQVPSGSSFRVEPGLSLGAGMLVPLDAKKSLDVALRYHYVKNSGEPEIPGDIYVAASQFFTLTVGISFGFAAP
jgi:hypothetical protein